MNHDHHHEDHAMNTDSEVFARVDAAISYLLTRGTAEELKRALEIRVDQLAGRTTPFESWMHEHGIAFKRSRPA